jgi:hypothetical protein
MPVEQPAIAIHVGALTEMAFSRLIRALGREKGILQGQAALHALGVKELLNANDLLRFANHLIGQGGVTESVGRALKVTALLRGGGAKQKSAEKT